MEYEIEKFPPFSVSEGKKLSDKPYIHPTCIIRESKIGRWTELQAFTQMSESTFGDYSYTAGNVSIIYSDVGNFCSIANSVRINPGNHPQWRVTQHHFTYRRKMYNFDSKDDHDFFDWRRNHKCEIGHDVWIGHGAIIMPGVKIASGAIIGSGAVVTKDIGPYEIAVGVAAKVIKKRFSDRIIEKLLESQWWEWDHATIRERLQDLMHVESFVEKYC